MSQTSPIKRDVHFPSAIVTRTEVEPSEEIPFLSFRRPLLDFSFFRLCFLPNFFLLSSFSPLPFLRYFYYSVKEKQKTLKKRNVSLNLLQPLFQTSLSFRFVPFRSFVRLNKFIVAENSPLAETYVHTNNPTRLCSYRRIKSKYYLYSVLISSAVPSQKLLHNIKGGKRANLEKFRRRYANKPYNDRLRATGLTSGGIWYIYSHGFV